MSATAGVVPAFAAGLPTHSLVLHAVVVLVPLTCLLLAVCAFSDTARRRAGLLLPVAGVGSLVLSYAAVESGEALLQRLPPDPVRAAHAGAGEAVLPWAVGVALVSVVLWWVAARAREVRPAAGGSHVPPGQVWRCLPARSVASVVLAALATTAAVGATARVVQAGHLGASATWGYVAQLPAPAG
ncbi:hypothetical protein NUM3379_03500 [Kineococcus sp. NUM-3379]